ncbi:MAG: pantetheine-phosphate adenylyltransferase [Muribaculaceae bacterium]|nr:pantetheine-phosphate adenylyltransferase [Muribaculaceae bacterium]
MATALFQGSFDPFTIGHADIVRRALNIFDQVVIAIVVNVEKKGLLSLEQRRNLIEQVFADEPRVRIVASEKLTVEVAHDEGATCLLRGVRTTQDFEYEQVMAQANRELGGLDTVLLFTRPEYAHVSSSLVRELLRFGRDVTPYLPAGITLPPKQ